MMYEKNFVEILLLELKKLRDANMDRLASEDQDAEFHPNMIKHWLNFAVYYERASVSFIGHWLKDTPEDDALHYFTRQIEDESNHYRWFKRHLREYTDQYDEFTPPAEWKFLMEDYYPNLGSLVERLAAHNIAAETGVLGFMEYGQHRFPENIQETLKKVIKDEMYHVAFGKKLLNKYCHSYELQKVARHAALESVENMAKAREVFVNI